MCYPKPGPRCSAHAAAQLTKAKLNLKTQKRSIFDPKSQDIYQTLKQAVSDAQLNYDATPAGMKELERRALYDQGPQSEEYKLRLELGKALRQKQLEAIKQTDAGDIKHPSKAISNDYSKNKHTNSAKIIRKGYPDNAPEIVSMIEESQSWVNVLDTDETEAVSWFTSNGASTINKHLVGAEKDNIDLKYSEEFLDETVTHMDSALKKWEREKPILVYRGINESISGERTSDKEKNVF